jgi:hypothetical protein
MASVDHVYAIVAKQPAWIGEEVYVAEPNQAHVDLDIVIQPLSFC